MAESAVSGRPAPALRRVLIPLALAQFICSFAGSNMNVMITDISHDLDTSVQGVQTAITVFLLVMAALMIPGGKLTDRYGRTRCLTLGLTVYGIGALLAACAPGLGVLIVTGILAADNNIWWTVGLILAGAAVLTWFFLSVRAKERAGIEPLLSTALFRNRTSNLGLVTQNVQWLILLGTSFTVASYL